jgi:hypothetical protein
MGFKYRGLAGRNFFVSYGFWWEKIFADFCERDFEIDSTGDVWNRF